ncbi:hypothetical protein TWF506_008048 [Arthrobotrys conoides]|uniref:Uncharacterized protein n=1 Tax=Arthrobotrys conoides TaxID=74498 RepID=A0AAN8N8Q9_9PEZI
MQSLLTLLTAFPPLTTILYYTITLLLSFLTFLFVLLFIFINTPGEFTHPYYESSGFGNDHFANRGYPGRRRTFFPPPARARARGGMGFVRRTRAGPRFFLN